MTAPRGSPPPAPPRGDGLADDAELRRALLESPAAELEALVEALLPRLDAGDARLVLRNPFLTPALVTLLAEQPGLVSAYELRRDLAGHPRSPEIVALRFVPGLYWRDLVAIGTDVRVRPTVRRSCELALLERIAGLAVGERISIARTASPMLLVRLLHDPIPKVVEAALDNPRLTEIQVLQLVSGDSCLPAVLAVVAHHRRTATSMAVRVALARNARTPPTIAVPLLASLRKTDLRAVASDPHLPPATRRRAQLLLGQR